MSTDDSDLGFALEHAQQELDACRLRVEQLEGQLAGRQLTPPAESHNSSGGYSVFDTLIEGFQVLDFDWRYVYVNDAAAQHGRRPRQELIDQSLLEQYPGIEQTPVFALMQKSMQMRTHESMENEFVFPDGSSGSFEIRVQPVPEGIIVLSLDITERKRSVMATETSEQRLRLFVEHAPAAIAMFDNDMRYLLVSQRWLRDYRLTEADVIGRSHYDVFPEIPDSLREIHRRCLHGAVEHGVDQPFRRADGSLDWVSWEAHPWRDHTGAIGGIFLFSEVVTERVQAQVQLRQSEARYRLLAENMADVVWILDTDTARFTYVSPSVEQLRGFTPDEVLAQPLEEVITPESFARTAKELPGRIRAFLEGNQRAVTQRDEVEQYCRDGSTVWTEVTTRLVRSSSGAVQIVGVSRDIAERKQAETRILRLNRTLGVLSDVNQAIVRVRHLPALFEKICEIAVAKGAFMMAWIGLLDADGSLSVAAQSGVPDEYLALLRANAGKFRQGRDPTATAIVTGAHVVYNELVDEHQHVLLHDSLIHVGGRSLAALPLIVDGTVQGVFDLYAREPGFFDDEELKLLDEMALDVSFAIEVARQDEQRKQAERAEHEQRVLAEALRDSLVVLTGSFDVETVLRRILDYSATVIPSEAGTLILFENGQGHIIYMRGYPPEAEAYFREHRISLNTDLFRQEPERYRYYLAEDTRLMPDWLPYPYTEWIRSSVGVQIVSGGEVLGMLIADSATPYRFTAKDVDNLQAFARYASLALDNAYHISQLERWVSERTADLRAAKARVEAILNSSADGILLVNEQLAIEETNETFCEMFGCGTVPSEGQPLSAFVTSSIGDSLPLALQTAISRRENTRLELRARRRDGSEFDAEISLGFVKDDGFVCSIRDITERKAQERQLHFQASVQDNVSDAVIVTDLEFRIQSWNKAAERIYGWTEEEVLGKSSPEILRSVLTPEDRDRTVRELYGQGWWQAEVRQHHKDGSERTILGAITLLKDQDGVPFGVVGVNRDITERKRAEEALEARLEEERVFQSYLKGLHEITIELTQIDDLNVFYRQTVELGRSRLGFERLAMFLYDERDGLAIGTYGTDVRGRLSDERHVRFYPGGIMERAFGRAERFYLDDHAPLFDDMEFVGYGWNVATVLRSGAQKLGWLVADNLLSGAPASKSFLDILSLYAIAVGSLLAQKRSQMALRESEARYRLLADHATDLIVRQRPTGEFIYVSPSSRAVVGYDPEELTGRNGIEFVHPDDIADMRRSALGMLSAKQTSVNVTFRFRHKQGHYLWLEATGRVIYSPAGEPLELIESARDITERKLISVELEQQRAFLQKVIDVSPSNIFVKDADARFLLVNPAMARHYGSTPDAMIGKTDTDFGLPEAEITQFLNADRRAIETGETMQIEERVSVPAGETRWFQTIKVPISASRGAPTLVLGVSTDITEHKHLEDSLRKAVQAEKELNELKSRFVSMASHEFRTPLATILALTETIQAYRHKLPDSDVDQRLDRIKLQVGHLNAVMEDMLLLARMQSQRVEFQPIDTDLDDLCRTIIGEFSERPDLVHHIGYQVTGSPRAVRLDSKLVRQIIANLISNAIKYSPDSSAVAVDLEFNVSHALVTVSDHGIGIPEADLKHLFEPFHRASNVGTISGTGLGLVIAREAVELHGGTIDVDSTVGVGTTFTVSLPLGVS